MYKIKYSKEYYSLLTIIKYILIFTVFVMIVTYLFYRNNQMMVRLSTILYLVCGYSYPIAELYKTSRVFIEDKNEYAYEKIDNYISLADFKDIGKYEKFKSLNNQYEDDVKYWKMKLVKEHKYLTRVSAIEKIMFFTLVIMLIILN